MLSFDGFYVPNTSGNESKNMSKPNILENYSISEELEEVHEWSTYKNELHGFQFDYPSKIINTKGIITMESLPDGWSLEEWAERGRHSIRCSSRSNGEGRVLSEELGFKVYIVEEWGHGFTCEATRLSRFVIIYLLSDKGYLVSINYHHDYDYTEGVAESIVNSFEVDDFAS